MRRYANKPTTEWLMTTDWVTATKWPVGRSGWALPTYSAPKRRGDRQGCQWPQCGRGERRIRWRKIYSSDRDSRTLLTCGKLLWVSKVPFPSPTDVPNNQHTSENPSRLQAHQWKHNIAGCRITANFTVCVQFRKQGGLPLPGASKSQW